MIRVNLLPEDLRKIARARKVKADIAVFSGGAIAVGVLIALIAFVMVGRRVNHLAQVKRRLNRLSAQREEADALLKQKLELAKELEMMDGFSTRRLLWHRRLNEVSDAVPEDCLFKKLSYSSNQPSTLTIKGEASPGQGNSRVVEFIDSLHHEPGFLKEFPQINYSIDSIEQGRKSFEITCTRLKRDEKKDEQK